MGGEGGRRGISGRSLLRCLKVHFPLLLTLYVQVRGDGGGLGGGGKRGAKGQVVVCCTILGAMRKHIGPLHG